MARLSGTWFFSRTVTSAPPPAGGGGPGGGRAPLAVLEGPRRSARVQLGGPNPQPQVDVVVLVPGLVVDRERLATLLAAQVLLRQRGALVRDLGLLPDHDDGAVEPSLAQRLGCRRRAHPSADDDEPPSHGRQSYALHRCANVLPWAIATPWSWTARRSTRTRSWRWHATGPRSPSMPRRRPWAPPPPSSRATPRTSGPWPAW